MPELPEVEVVKKSLQKEIINLIIKKVKINDINLRYKVKKQDFRKIIGSKVLKVNRRSKYLLVFLTNNKVMTIHLGMTGKFFVLKKNSVKKTSFYYDVKSKNKNHDRIIFYFNNNVCLIYNDVRKFGFIKILKLNDLKNNKHLKILGPEPISSLYSLKYFKNYIIGRNKNIKNLLMDQKFISGLGNIYVNEILFFSKIRPTKKINKLKEIHLKLIIKNTKNVLKKAINLGGSSIKDFSNSSGKKGNFQDHFSVYGKKGYKCNKYNCNGIIKKVVISNRASFFCPICQK